MESSSDIAALLREICDAAHALRERQDEALAMQRIQIERQAEAMALQREQVVLVRSQFERAERIQERAEALQGSARKAMRLVLGVAIPLVLVLLAFVAWNLFSNLSHRW